MYTVIYYAGGEKFGSWHRTTPVATIEDALALAARIQRGGRPATYYKTASLDEVGLPNSAPAWWDFEHLCHRIVWINRHRVAQTA